MSILVAAAAAAPAPRRRESFGTRIYYLLRRTASFEAG